MHVIKQPEMGRFNYREPKIPQFGSSNATKFPLVILYADAKLKPLFPYFLEAINSNIELARKKEHKILIERIGDDKSTRFKLTIDGKKIVMVDLV
jgi:hypothetical protein